MADYKTELDNFFQNYSVLGQNPSGVGAAQTRPSYEEELNKVLAPYEKQAESLPVEEAPSDADKTFHAKAMQELDSVIGPAPARRSYGQLFLDAAERTIQSMKSIPATARAISARQKGDLNTMHEQMAIAKQYEDAAPKPELEHAFMDVWNDPSLDKFGVWATETLGEQVPNLAVSMLGGGVGAIAGRAATRGLMSSASPTALSTGAKVGAFGTGFTTTTALETADTTQELYDVTKDINVPLVLTAGVTKGALEFITPWFLGRKALGLGPKTSFGKAAITTGLLEGAAEYGQEETSIAARWFSDPNYSYFGPEANTRRVNSLAAGLLVGGAVGGALEKGRPTKEEKQKTLTDEEVERIAVKPSPINWMHEYAEGQAPADIQAMHSPMSGQFDAFKAVNLTSRADTVTEAQRAKHYYEAVENSTDRYAVQLPDGSYLPKMFTATDWETARALQANPTLPANGLNFVKVDPDSLHPAGITADIADLPEVNNSRVTFLPGVTPQEKVQLLQEYKQFRDSLGDVADQAGRAGYVADSLDSTYNDLLNRGLRVVPSYGHSFFYTYKFSGEDVGEPTRSKRSTQVGFLDQNGNIVYETPGTVHTNLLGPVTSYMTRDGTYDATMVAVDMGKLKEGEYSYVPVTTVTNVLATMARFKEGLSENEAVDLFNDYQDLMADLAANPTDDVLLHKAQELIRKGLYFPEELGVGQHEMLMLLTDKPVLSYITPGLAKDTESGLMGIRFEAGKRANLNLKPRSANIVASVSRPSRQHIEHLQDVLNELSAKFKINAVQIIVQGKQHNSEFQDGKTYGLYAIPDGLIYLNSDKLQAMESLHSRAHINTFITQVIIHEYGHHVTLQNWHKLSKATQQKIKAEYQRYLLALRLNNVDVNFGDTTPLNAGDTGTDPQKIVDNYKKTAEYFFSFSEFLAEQFVRWMHSLDVKPSNAKEKFYVNVVLQLKELYAATHAIYKKYNTPELVTDYKPMPGFAALIQELIGNQNEQTHFALVTSALNPLAVTDTTWQRMSEALTEAITTVKMLPRDTEIEVTADQNYLGAYVSQSDVIKLSMYALDSKRGVNRIIAHEALHRIKKLGILTEGEWNTLVQKAKKEVKLNESLVNRYKTLYIKQGKLQGLQGAELSRTVNEALNEEWVASLVELRMMGKVVDAKTASLLDRIIEFFRILGQKLAARFNSGEHLLQRLIEGQITERWHKELDRREKVAEVIARKMEERASRGGVATSVRLYRGEPVDAKGGLGIHYTRSLDRARGFAGEGGKIYVVDVPLEEMGQLKASRAAGNYIVPQHIRETRREYVEEDNSSRYMFAGEQAATADLVKLNKAKGMAEQGIPAEEIWKETGWFQRGDGGWRFELDDSKITVKTTKRTMHEKSESGELAESYLEREDWNIEVTAARLEEIITSLTTRVEELKTSGNTKTAKELEADIARYKAALAVIQGTNTFTFSPGLSKKKGLYGDPDTYQYNGRLDGLIEASDLFEAYPMLKSLNVTVGNMNSFTSSGGLNPTTRAIKVQASDNVENILDTLIHEIQHAIQLEEGFDSGGNDATLQMRTEVALYELTQQIAGLHPGSNMRGELETLREILRDQVEKFSGGVAGFAATNAGIDSYLRLLGEVEARNAAFRRTMPPEQRARWFPLDSEDIAPEEQYSGTDLVQLSVTGDSVINEAVEEEYAELPSMVETIDRYGPKTETRYYSISLAPLFGGDNNPTTIVGNRSNYAPSLRFSKEGIANAIKTYGTWALRQHLAEHISYYTTGPIVKGQVSAKYVQPKKHIERLKLIDGLLARIEAKHPELQDAPGYTVTKLDTEKLIEKYEGKTYTEDDVTTLEEQISDAIGQLKGELVTVTEYDKKGNVTSIEEVPFEPYDMQYDFNAQGIGGDHGIQHYEGYDLLYSRNKALIDEYLAAVAYVGYARRKKNVGLAWSMNVLQGEGSEKATTTNVDKLGYYSQALEAAKALKQAKGTPEQMLAQLRRAGVKSAEIEATELDKMLAGKKSVTRDEIVTYLETARIELEEDTSNLSDRAENDRLIMEEVDRILSTKNKASLTSISAEHYDMLDYMYTTYGAKLPDVWRAGDGNIDEILDAFPSLELLLEANAAQWADYSLDPKNPSYQETVFYLSDVDETFKETFYGSHFPQKNIVGHMMTSINTFNDQLVYTIDQIQSDWGQKMRESGLRDEAKIATLKARYAEVSNKYEEMSSTLLPTAPYTLATELFGEYATWASLSDEQRKAALDLSAENTAKNKSINSNLDALSVERNRVNAEWRLADMAAVGHPLVNNTDQWVNTVLRRAIPLAIKAGARHIAIPSGATVLSYNPGEEHGMNEFYSKIVPKNLRNILQKLDKDTPPAQHSETLTTPTKGPQGKGFTIFTITDKVVETVVEKGQTMFALNDTVEIELQKGDAVVEKMEEIRPGLWVVKTNEVGTGELYSFSFFATQPQDTADPFVKIGHNHIGEVMISLNSRGFEVDNMYVNAQYRGNRISDELYRYIEGELNTVMRPSGMLTPDGYKMWKKRNPDAVRYHILHKGADNDGGFYVSPNYILDKEKLFTRVLEKVGSNSVNGIDAKRKLEEYAKLKARVDPKAWGDPELESMFALDEKDTVYGTAAAVMNAERRNNTEAYNAYQHGADPNSVQQEMFEIKQNGHSAVVDIPLEMMRKVTRIERDPEVRKTLMNDLGEADKISKASSVFLSLHQIMWRNPHFNAGREYIATVEAWNASKMKWISTADMLARRWDKLKPREQKAKLADFMFWLTEMRYRTPAEVSNGTLRYPTPQEVRAYATKNKLERETVALASEISQAFKDFLTDLERISAASIMRNFRDVNARNQALADLSVEMAQLRARPYFPLMRFGQYTVTVRDTSDLTRILAFYTFESEAARQAAIRDIIHTHRGHKIQIGKIPENVQEFMGIPPRLVRMIRTQLPGGLTTEQMDWLEQLEHHVAPENSFRKRFIHRRNVEGYSMDGIRAFSFYFMTGANYLARLEYRDQLQDIITNSRQEAKVTIGIGTKRTELLDYMQNHLNFIMEPGKDWGKLKGLIGLWYLGFSPAAAATNLTQIPVFTYPFLANVFGEKAAYRLLTQTTKGLKGVVMGENYLSGDTGYDQARLELIEQGKIDAGQAPELAAMADSDTLTRLSAGTAGQRFYRGLAHYGMWMFQQTERFNRELTFATTYQLAVNDPNNQWLRDNILIPYYLDIMNLQAKRNMTQAQAVATFAARRIIDQTQFVYSSWARPKVARGGLPGTLLIFQMYIQSALYSVWNNPGAKRSILMLMLLAGLMGLPGMDDFMQIINFVVRSLEGDFNTQKEVRTFVRHISKGTIFDEVGPDLFLHGISRYGFGLGLLPDSWGAPKFDASANVGMGKVLSPMSELLKEWGTYGKFNDIATKTLQDASGAGFGYFFNLMQFLTQDPLSAEMKQWEKVMQRSLKAVERGVRYAWTGKEVTPSGAVLATFDWKDPSDRATIIAQILGFNPQVLGQKYEYRTYETETEKYYKGWRTALMKDLETAIQSQDDKTIQKAIGKITAYNAKVESLDQAGLSIQTQQVISSIRNRVRNRTIEELGLPRWKSQTPSAVKDQDLFPGVKFDMTVK